MEVVHCSVCKSQMLKMELYWHFLLSHGNEMSLIKKDDCDVGEEIAVLARVAREGLVRRGNTDE